MTLPRPTSANSDRLFKEARLDQRACVIWLFGLSGAGKSSLARALESRLLSEGRMTRLIDGDQVRLGLNHGLGFSEADRTENIRRAAEVSKLFLETGIIVIAAFITPHQRMRDLARSIIGPDDFFGVHVDAPYDVCAQRDTKGLYAQAAAGELKQFTGKDAAFEAPAWADLVLHTDRETEAESLGRLHAAVQARLSRINLRQAKVVSNITLR